MINYGLYSRLSGYAALASIGDNWYPGALPQGVDYPAGVFTCISRVRAPSQQGGGPYDTRYQFDIYADDPDECESLLAALDACMHGYSGTITVAGTDYVIGASLLAGGFGPKGEPVADGPNPGGGRFRGSHDYKIWHQEV